MNEAALYVVATPIGNLGDMSPRAIEVLRGVDRIAAEDTRHSAALMRHFGIDTPMQALHEHNERQVSSRIIEQIQQGQSIALISDAGTPLVSDPGYVLVREAQAAGIKVVPIPGPSALIAALSCSGMPTDRFSFEGFLPHKSGPRRKRLEAVREDPRTLVFYESPHRILDCLEDMIGVFGAEREAVMARELTKTFETIRRLPLAELQAFVQGDDNQQKGEYVLLLAGAEAQEGDELGEEVRRMASILAEELPVKQAAALAARVSGEKKNRIYKYLLNSQ